jgi:anti-anti-sigma regulatory factor/HAMP domain-containing protein
MDIVMMVSPSQARNLKTSKVGNVLRSFTNRSLRTKLILAFLAVTALSVSAVAFLNNRATSAELTAVAGNTLHQEAATEAQAVGDLLARQVNTLQAFGLNKFVQDQLAVVNTAYTGDTAAIQAQIQTLDKRWVAAGDNDPLVQDRLNNQVAAELRRYGGAFPDNVEIFVTDKYGANVAVSNRTSDYFQADERWWQAAWNNGEGAVSIGQPQFDESSRSFSIVIAVPIHSQESNAVIGILRTTYRLDKLIDLIAKVRVGATGRAQLMLPGGQFIAQDKTVATLDSATVAQLQGLSAAYGDFSYQGVRRFVSQAPLTTTTGDSAIGNLGWRLVVYQDRAESLQPATIAVQTSLIVALSALLLAVALGIGVAYVISAPLGRLTRIAREIAQGDLGRRLRLPQHDEIGQLGQSFDAMADTLEARLAEQQQMYEAVAAQHAEQQRLLDVISELETPIIPLGRGVLLVPLIGSLDARRAEAACARILTNVMEYRAQQVILDLTGVALTDGAVASQLLMIVQSVRLLGPEVLFTGIRAEMAMMLVQSGSDVGQFRSVATLEAAIESLIALPTRIN